MKAREDIDEQYKWNPEVIFEKETAWEQAADRVETRLRDLSTENLLGSPEDLVETLDEFFAIRAEFERVEVYAMLRADIDTTDERAQELSGRVNTLRTILQTIQTTIETNVQQTDAERVRSMVAESEGLGQYDHYLQDLIRQTKHTADPIVEEALSTLAPALGGHRTYETLLNADLSFPPIEKPEGGQVELTLNNREKQLRFRNRTFRRTVHRQFYDTLSEYRHTIASTFDQHVETTVRKAKLRGYDSSLEATLGPENVPVEVYEILATTVTTNIDPLHEHLKHKRRRLEVDVLRPWDLNVRLVGDDPTVPYEKAKELVVEAVAPLGEGYQSRLLDGLESGWVDVYESPDKTTGAGTVPAYSTEPYILLNYQADVNWLFGLAHEAGHAMHAALTSQSQPVVYGDFDWFISEVPSTLTEILLVRHILQTADDSPLRRAVLDMWLERFRDLLYRRTRYAVCEQQLHELVSDGGRLTAHRLDHIITDGWELFNAPVKVDDRIAGEWMHIKYLMMWKPFYVYQYATGFVAALSLATDIREEWNGTEVGDAGERYLRLVRSGSSDYPLNLLTDAGVDLRTAEPFEQAVDAYHDVLAKYERMILR